MPHSRSTSLDHGPRRESGAEPINPLSQPTAWNLVSRGYASEIVPHFTRYAVDVVRMANLGPKSKVGDIACGPGTLSFVAGETGAQVLALDFSPDMIAELQERASRHREVRIKASIGDGQSLPWSDGELDAVFCMFGLVFFCNRHHGLCEMHRTLKPGGRAFVTSWAPFDNSPAIGALFRALREAMPGVPFGNSQAPLEEPSKLEFELQNAGFPTVEIRTLTHTIERPDIDTFWASALIGVAPLVLMKHRMGVAFTPFANRVLEKLHAYMPPSPVRVDMTANLGIGTKQ